MPAFYTCQRRTLQPTVTWKHVLGTATIGVLALEELGNRPRCGAVQYDVLRLAVVIVVHLGDDIELARVRVEAGDSCAFTSPLGGDDLVVDYIGLVRDDDVPERCRGE